MDVVDAGDRRPVFRVFDPREREGSVLPSVGVSPIAGYDSLRGVRRMLQSIVGGIKTAIFDGGDLGVDRFEGFAEAIELGLALTFCWLDHERATDGPAHGGSMVTKVHQTLRHVLDSDFFEVAEIDDALVCDESFAAFVKRRKARLELFGHVVRMENGGLCGLDNTRTHHGEVHPRDGADAGATPRRGTDGTL